MNGDHAEYRYHNDGDTAVVFIHGILGNPSQFSYLVDRLGGRYYVENLLLPGHGGSVMEFARSSMNRWQTYVNERVSALEKAYRHILLVGHSMGCLLAVQAALLYPKRIQGLFLLAVPLVIRPKSPSVVTRMTSALAGGSNASPDVPKAEGGNRFPYLFALPRFVELFLKSRTTRPLIERVRAPMFVIQSENDETVSNRSLRYMERLPNVSLMIAKDSGHFYYPQESKALIADALIRFIERTRERNTSNAL